MEYGKCYDNERDHWVYFHRISTVNNSPGKIEYSGTKFIVNGMKCRFLFNSTVYEYTAISDTLSWEKYTEITASEFQQFAVVVSFRGKIV
jgi:hypothetical protein